MQSGSAYSRLQGLAAERNLGDSPVSPQWFAPNLWQLLQEPGKRVTEFAVGSREFDPKNVGFDIGTGPSRFKVYKSDGRTIQPGNSNRGHAYGTELTDAQKWTVIKYMKTL